MQDTAWRKRPAAMADVGNPTGLVTSPRDVARFGQMVLDAGRAADGRRVVSQAGLAALFARSANVRLPLFTSPYSEVTFARVRSASR